MSVIVRTTLLLAASNIFMTFAWYAHLKNLNHQKWYIAAVLSWGIALFEYLLQVPANRIGYTQFSIAQLKVTQEVITLSVFAPFAVFYMREPVKLDYLWGGFVLARRGLFYVPFLVRTNRGSERGISGLGFREIVPRRWRPCSRCPRQ